MKKNVKSADQQVVGTDDIAEEVDPVGNRPQLAPIVQPQAQLLGEEPRDPALPVLERLTVGREQP